MPTKKLSELENLFIKRLMIVGILFIVVGALWLNNVEWPIILIVVGAILLLKSFIMYHQHKMI